MRLLFQSYAVVRSLALLGIVAAGVVEAGVRYDDPADGWLYRYEGTFNQGVDGLPDGYGNTGNRMALDGTWRHDQSSKWDGTAPGDLLSDPTIILSPPYDPLVISTPGGGNLGTSPGGAGAYVEDSTTYIRIQDTGNPDDHGWDQVSVDPANTNRRIYFGHDMFQDGVTGEDQMFLDDGFTFSFRARLPNTGPMDTLIYPSDGDTEPWFPEGQPERTRGYPIHNTGRGMFTLVQNQVFDDFGDIVNKDYPIAFSLISAADIADIPGGVYTTGSGMGGLVMNNLNGSSPNAQIDITGGGSLNLLEIEEEELVEWHEFWMTIEDNGGAAGTHKVRVYMDGEVDDNGDPAFTDFNVTSTVPNQVGYSNDNSAFVEFGMSNNALFGMVDIDFISFKLGVHVPVVAVLFDDADFDQDGDVDGDDFLLWQGGFGTASDAEKMDGDADNDGDVDGDDFLRWQSQFGNSGGDGSSSAVPEPAAAALYLCLVVPLTLRRFRSAS